MPAAARSALTRLLHVVIDHGHRDFFVPARKLALDAAGNPSMLVRMMPKMTVATILAMCLVMYYRMESFVRPNPVDTIMLALTATGSITLNCLGKTVRELAVCLRPNGELEKLGVGSAKIAESALALLVRQRLLTRSFQVISTGGGFLAMGMTLTYATYLGLARAWAILLAATLVGFQLVVLIPMTIEFNLALQTAAALTADAVLEVVLSACEVSPDDNDEWESRVVQPALALADGPVGILSRGFGRGLALSYVGFWATSVGMLSAVSFSLGFVLQVANSWRLVGLVATLAATLALLLLPLVMSEAVAEVSTSCDDLGNAINRECDRLDNCLRYL